MSAAAELLPSWRAGATRDAVLAFLDAAREVPIEQRVAAFDNDGTLWCERPTYAQLDFFVDELRKAAAADGSLADRAEYAAVLAGDQTAMDKLGLERIAIALAELLAGIEPEDFSARVRAFMATAEHRTLGVRLRRTVYQPMLELLDELRRCQFAVFIVTGGGTEFVRAISADLYGVPAEAVVGTMIEYDYAREDGGRPVLRRTAHIHGPANEGAAKVSNIQSQIGRRPILAAGNSGGDREMLEWACTAGSVSLAVLLDHDDDEREFRYVSTAQTVAEPERITKVAERLGWTTVSMARDWSELFPTS